MQLIYFLSMQQPYIELTKVKQLEKPLNLYHIRRAVPQMQEFEFRSANGYTAVLTPSVYINERFKTLSQEKVLLVLDLDETISLDKCFVDEIPKEENIVALDLALKEAIDNFKRNRPNGEVILVTKSLSDERGAIDKKLEKNRLLKDDFTRIYSRSQNESGASLITKEHMLEKAISEYGDGQKGSPKRVVFCDDQVQYLDDGASVCERHKVKYEGVRVHAARPYKAIKKAEGVYGSLQRTEMMEAKVSEKAVYEAMSAAEKHNHLMLTPDHRWSTASQAEDNSDTTST